MAAGWSFLVPELLRICFLAPFGDERSEYFSCRSFGRLSFPPRSPLPTHPGGTLHNPSKLHEHLQNPLGSLKLTAKAPSTHLGNPVNTTPQQFRTLKHKLLLSLPPLKPLITPSIPAFNTCLQHRPCKPPLKTFPSNVEMDGQSGEVHNPTVVPTIVLHGGSWWRRPFEHVLARNRAQSRARATLSPKSSPDPQKGVIRCEPTQTPLRTYPNPRDATRTQPNPPEL